MMNCQKIQTRLSAYEDGELPLELRQAIAEHLPGCSACAAHLEGMRALSQALKGVREIESNAVFTNRVLFRIANRKPRSMFERHSWLPRLVYSFVFIFVFSAAFISNIKPIPAPLQPQVEKISLFSQVQEASNLNLLGLQESSADLITEKKP